MESIDELINTGKTQLESGEYDNALNSFQKAMMLNENDPDLFSCMGYEPLMGDKIMKTSNKKRSDAKLNKKMKGYAVAIIYDYLEKYDPDYKPADK